MDADTNSVPPAAQLLVSEIATCPDRTSARKRLRSLLKELRQQSEVYRENRETDEIARRRPLEFDVQLHGGLDLFELDGGCRNLPCRLRAADRLSRSIGLIADRIWISDTLTRASIHFGSVTDEKLDLMIDHAQVLSRLWPLVDAGIIHFRPTWGNFCESCISQFERSIKATVNEIAADFVREIKLEAGDSGTYIADTGRLFEPAVTIVQRGAGKNPPTKESILADLIYREVRSALWVGRDAAKLGGAIFSNSRIGLAGLLQNEGRLDGRAQLMALDNQRSLQVPWVNELTPAQILQLRQEAADALPIFREKLAAALASNTGSQQREGAATALIQELRAQSLEVRAELLAAQKNSAKYWKVTYALLGLGLSAYGVAADQVVAGVGGLLPLINLLISHKSGHEKEVSKLTSRPGYVLVKAQDILAHAD